jgi:hypothetical protein
MYILVAIVIALIFTLFTPIEIYFNYIPRKYKSSLEYGLVFMTYEIDILKRTKKKQKKEKKKKNYFAKALKHIQYKLDLKIYIPIEAFSNLYIPTMVGISEVAKFFINSSKLKLKYKIISSFETFMLKGILTVSIWNIIKAILKSR